MDKLRCIVVDDEPLAVQMLENFISRTPSLQLEASFNDPVLALEEINRRTPELVFLDIQMPDLSGLELSRMIPEQTKVIFTTAFKDYALDSYEIGAVDYLLKPIRYNKFLAATERAASWFELKRSAAGPQAAAAPTISPAPQKQDTVFVKADGRLHRISFSDILYLSGMKDYISIRLASRLDPLITHMTMKAAEEMLPQEMFMRVHRSYIVSLNKIDSVTSAMDIIIDGKLIPLGEQYAPAFKSWIEGKSLGK